MTPKLQKIVVLVFTSMVFLATIIMVSWQLIELNKKGWAGIKVGDNKSVHFVYYGGPADKAGIQVGKDSVLKINEIPTTATRSLCGCVTAAGDTATYLIKRGERELAFTLRLESPLKTWQIVFMLIADAFIGLIFFSLGLFVYLKKPQDRRAFVIYWLSVFAAASFLLHVTGWELNQAGSLGLGGGSTPRSFTSFLILTIAFLVFLPLTLHFVLVFPGEKPIIKKYPRLIRWIYFPPLFVCVLACVSFLIISAFPLKQQNLSVGFAAGLILGVIVFILLIAYSAIIIVFSIVTFANLYPIYRKAGIEEKRQIRWSLWGIALAVPFPLGKIIFTEFFTKLFGVIYGQVNFFYFLVLMISNAFYLFIPLSLVFAILKYRLLDIDLIIKKTITYAMLTGLIIVFYLSMVAGLGNWLVNYVGVKSQLVTIFSTLVIAAAFMPMKNRVQGFVDRRFFRNQYDYPQALRVLGHEISQAVELQLMLKLVAEHLVKALQNRAVVIFTKGQHERTFTAAAKVGVLDEVLGRVKFEPNNQLLTMMNAVFAPPPNDLPEEERRKLHQVGDALIVPVKQKGDLIGFISLGTKLSDEEFDAGDKEFLTAVADQMAVGMDNLRLREQEKDFEKAREIQQRLLPKEIPQIPGYEISGIWQPARAVGGDYFDVLKFSESKIGLCIADVVGKGMPAALLMSNLQAAVKAFASEKIPPKELCEKVNRFIRGNIAADKFITFFYGLLDAERKKFVFSRAGHNPPILIHHDGAAIRLERGGPVFGLFQECGYEQEEVELAAGDRVLLFTDGVNEAMNAEEEEFGEERLMELLVKNRTLGAAELQNRVINAVAEFTGGEFQDDVTMIVVAVE